MLELEAGKGVREGGRGGEGGGCRGGGGRGKGGGAGFGSEKQKICKGGQTAEFAPSSVNAASCRLGVLHEKQNACPPSLLRALCARFLRSERFHLRLIQHASRSADLS